MSTLGMNRAVRHEAVPSRATLEARLREVAAMSHVPREVDAELYAYSHVFHVWRYFASALTRNGKEEPLPTLHALNPSDSPLAWAVRARHRVASFVWLNTPHDVTEIDARLRAVTGEEFAAIFHAEREVVVAEYEAGGLSPERARGSAGPAHFGYEAVEWGNLRAFYARAASEQRYVVCEVRT